MPTLRQYRQAMLRISSGLGRVEAIASGTVTTMVVNALIGSYRNSHFVNQYLLRPDGSDTADRSRYCSASTGSTGTLTHAGDNYSDTTFTSENVELLRYEPYFYDEAINRVLHKLARLDVEIIPTHGRSRISLASMPWITGPGQRLEVKLRQSPVMNRNWRFEKWNGITSAGVLTPDDWTISGGTSTMAREPSVIEDGISPYALAVTYAGAAAVVSQTIARFTGVGVDSLQGKTVYLVGRARSGQASSVRLRMVETLSGGTTVTTDTSYAAADNQYHELASAAVKINDNTVSIAISGRVEVSETAYFSEIGLVLNSWGNAQRRDNPGYTNLDYDFSQYGNAPAIELASAYSWGSQVEVSAYRPYFVPTTRLTADGHNCDAPLEIVAYGAIAQVYKELRDISEGIARAGYEGLYQTYERQYQALAKGNRHVPDYSIISHDVAATRRPQLLAPYGSRR